MNKDSKSLFFLCLSLVCIWLILDNIYGHKYVNTFLGNMFDFMGGSSSGSSSTTKVYTTDKEDVDIFHFKDEKGFYKGDVDPPQKSASEYTQVPAPQYTDNAFTAPVV